MKVRGFLFLTLAMLSPLLLLRHGQANGYGRTSVQKPSSINRQRTPGEPDRNGALQTLTFLESREAQSAIEEINASPELLRYFKLSYLYLSGYPRSGDAIRFEDASGDLWMRQHASLVEKAVALGLLPTGGLDVISRERLATLDRIEGLIAFLLASHWQLAVQSSDVAEADRTRASLAGYVHLLDLPEIDREGFRLWFGREFPTSASLRERSVFDCPAEDQALDRNKFRRDHPQLGARLPTEDLRRRFARKLKNESGPNESRSPDEIMVELKDLSLEQIVNIGFDPSASIDTLPEILRYWPLRLKASYWLMKEQSQAMEIAAWSTASGETSPVDPITGEPFLIDTGGQELIAPFAPVTPVPACAGPFADGPRRCSIPQMHD